MTNSGIKTSRILDALYANCAEEWRQTNDRYVQLSFRKFTKILRKTQIAIDPRTIRLKWELLTDMDIFRSTTKISTAVDLNAFAGYGYDFTPLEGAHTHSHTHSSEGTGEASE